MKLKKIIKKIGLVDIIIIFAIITALVVGYMTFKKIRQTSDKQIVSTSEVVFHVLVRGFSFSGEQFPIQAGEKSFITIRNVPYTELNVENVVYDTRKIGVFANGQMHPVTDPAYPNLYDMVVILKDDAKITNDGPVVGGNKLKIGLPITIEGTTYKLNGTVSNVVILPPKKEDNK